MDGALGMEEQGHWNEIIALGQENQLTFSSLFVEVPPVPGGRAGKGDLLSIVY